MGLFSRASMIIKSKVNQAMDAAEDPRQTMEYSYQKQVALLAQVRSGVADAVTSEKRLEIQAEGLTRQIDAAERQARDSLDVNREDLARAALERKAALQSQLDALQKQIAGLKAEQNKLELAERKLTAQVEAFRTNKEVVKAQYDAAKAEVQIGEAVTGLSSEASHVNEAVQRAQDRTEAMKARAQAIDELTTTGVLSDANAPADPVAAELAKLKASATVQADLDRLKAENDDPKSKAG